MKTLAYLCLFISIAVTVFLHVIARVRKTGKPVEIDWQILPNFFLHIHIYKKGNDFSDRKVVVEVTIGRIDFD